MANKYIHYGSKTFDPNKINTTGNIISDILSKPYECFWASPIEAPYQSWKDWCESTGFHLNLLEESIVFSLSDNAKILKIHSDNDLNRIQEIDYYWDNIDRFRTLNYNQLYEMGYDGIEIFMASSNIRSTFWGWDADSLVLWNPDVIIF